MAKGVEGSIFKTSKKIKNKTGEIKEYIYWILEIRGQQHQFKTRSEAVAKRRSLAGQQASGIVPDKISVKQWLKKWTDKYKVNSVRETTLDSYLAQIDAHIVPELGHIELQELTTENVQDFANRLKDKGLSKRTIYYNIYILRTALQLAIDIEPPILFKNAAKKVLIPDVPKEPIVVIPNDKIEPMKQINISHPLYPAMLILFDTGIRRGELLGLKLECINWKDKTITIRYNLVKTKDGANLTEYPKTSAGLRVLPLKDETVEVLQGFVNKKPSKRSKYQNTPNVHNLVFHTRTGNWIMPDNFNRTADDWGKSVGLGFVTPHVFRHTFATRLIKNGIDIKTVSKLLGHEDPNFTAKIYVHPDIEMMRDAIATL